VGPGCVLRCIAVYVAARTRPWAQSPGAVLRSGWLRASGADKASHRLSEREGDGQWAMRCYSEGECLLCWERRPAERASVAVLHLALQESISVERRRTLDVRGRRPCMVSFTARRLVGCGCVMRLLAGAPGVGKIQRGKVEHIYELVFENGKPATCRKVAFRGSGTRPVGIWNHVWQASRRRSHDFRLSARRTEPVVIRSNSTITCDRRSPVETGVENRVRTPRCIRHGG